MTTRKTRFSLLALAATAALATTALAPTDASAFGRFGGYHFGHGGYHFGGFHRFGWRFGGYHFGHYGWGYRNYWWGRYHYPYRWWGWNRWYRWNPRPIAFGGIASAQSMTPEINDGIARVVTGHSGGTLVMRHAVPWQAATIIRRSGSNGFYQLNNSVTQGVTTYPRCKGWVGEC